MISALGHAAITPIIKKASLDRNEYKNYRPVSNIMYISKLIEKVVTNQITNHVTSYDLDEMYQSAYKANTSTETALLKVKSDILNAVDRQEVVFLVLLDLSAAFDTVDHKILLKRLHNRMGISGTALKWFETYLESRRCCVFIDGHYSDSEPLIYGVPQGSVVGPLQFILYTLPIGDIIRRHNIQFHQYADDTQLYVSFNPKVTGAAEGALDRLQHCISDLKEWMDINKLKFNSEKTELFIAGSQYGCQKLPLIRLRVGENLIEPSSHIKNLGVIFDTQMNMTKQINSIISSGYFQLRNIRRIGRYLNQDTKHHVVRSLILSKLDYGNALIYGSNMKDIRRLQTLQNRSAKFIFSAGRLESPKPLLDTLHWLPIDTRIKYKLCLYVFKCLHDHAPVYLNQCLHFKPRPSGPTTRSSSDRSLLLVPLSKKRIGDKAFTSAGPTLWNSLPRHLRELDNINAFKKMLKTYLYNL